MGLAVLGLNQRPQHSPVSGLSRPLTRQRLSGLTDRGEIVHVLDLHDDLINSRVDEGLGARAHLFRVTGEQSLFEIGVARTAPITEWASSGTSF